MADFSRHQPAAVIPCKSFTSLIDEMLSSREFVVYINNEKSKKCILDNGLPQGSVLAPLLFNPYISDMPPTSGRKFGYADDSAIATQSNSFRECEEILNKDLLALEKYFKKWGLKPNPKKTESITFHLNNHQANYQLKLSFCGQSVKHNSHPKYLGFTMDRSLTHRKHCENTAAKIKSRNNIIHKLCGTTWGADAETLRTSVIALVFSVAEYCSPALAEQCTHQQNRRPAERCSSYDLWSSQVNTHRVAFGAFKYSSTSHTTTTSAAERVSENSTKLASPYSFGYGTNPIKQTRVKKPVAKNRNQPTRNQI